MGLEELSAKLTAKKYHFGSEETYFLISDEEKMRKGCLSMCGCGVEKERRSFQSFPKKKIIPIISVPR